MGTKDASCSNAERDKPSLSQQQRARLDSLQVPLIPISRYNPARNARLVHSQRTAEISERVQTIVLKLCVLKWSYGLEIGSSPPENDMRLKRLCSCVCCLLARVQHHTVGDSVEAILALF